MKILIDGILPETKPPFWIGMRFTCGNCNCQFELERDDNVSVTSERRPNRIQTIYVKCPCCSYPAFYASNK